ncbi:hypothetical protein PG984_003487 [Apiospora sp. TS-2023a]
MRLSSEIGLLSLATGVASLSAASGFVSVDEYFQRMPEEGEPVREMLKAGSTERTVSFKPFETYWELLPKDSVLRDSEWKWLVKTGQGPVTNSSQSDGVEDPYLVSTAYYFSWPKGNNISDALGGAKGTMCTSTLESVDVPVSVLNKLPADDHGNGDCAPVLGQECVDALLSKQGGAITVEGDSCRDLKQSWHDIPACRDSLGKDRKSATQWAGTPLGGRNPANNATAPEWRSGHDFFLNISHPVTGRDSDEYLKRVNQLHVLMFDARIPAERKGQFVGGPQLLCTRVNATKLPGGEDAMLSESIRGNTSGAATGLACSMTLLMFGVTAALISMGV